MSDGRRALTLTIDANGDQDMRMLLKQALYEVERLLPPADDAPIEEKNAYRTRSFLQAIERPNVVPGHSTGTVGDYRFEFFNSSRAYHELEQRLLSGDYTKHESMALGYSGQVFIHETLPPKVIAGTPLEIRDAPKEALAKGFL